MAHAGFETVVIGGLIARCVDQDQWQGGKTPFRLLPVTRHTRLVIDQRDLLADEAVEEGRLAHIGASDDGEFQRHGGARSYAFRRGAPARRSLLLNRNQFCFIGQQEDFSLHGDGFDVSRVLDIQRRGLFARLRIKGEQLAIGRNDEDASRRKKRTGIADPFLLFLLVLVLRQLGDPIGVA